VIWLTATRRGRLFGPHVKDLDDLRVCRYLAVVTNSLSAADTRFVGYDFA
jgi:hypothetical protein